MCLKIARNKGRNYAADADHPELCSRRGRPALILRSLRQVEDEPRVLEVLLAIDLFRPRVPFQVDGGLHLILEGDPVCHLVRAANLRRHVSHPPARDVGARDVGIRQYEG